MRIPQRSIDSAKTNPTLKLRQEIDEVKLTERDDDKFIRCTMRVNYADVVPTFVDMDHLLSGTTYDKAPRGRAITIGC